MIETLQAKIDELLEQFQQATVALIDKIAEQVVPEEAEDYIANRNSKEIHKSTCFCVGWMGHDSKMPCTSLAEVAELIRGSGYNGCYYCLPRYDTDTLTLQQVLINLNSDL